MDKRPRAKLALDRWQLLRRVEDALETPMLVLGLLWLVLLVVELVRGLSAWQEVVGTII